MRGLWQRVIGLSLCLGLPGAGATSSAAAKDFWGAAAGVEAPAASAGWIRLADTRAGQGRYAAAAAAYLAAIAAGAREAAVSARLGDVLMAEGELASAEAAYRAAIAAAAATPASSTGSADREAVHLDDPRGRAQDAALACVGLAAALDRAGQTAAARQMVREALAADPTASVLEVATLPGSDVRILPEGEAFYRLGLVRQATGRRTDAVAAFREYLERAPGSRWAEAAQAHVAELEGPAGRGPARGARGGLRLLAAATVLSTGGVPAPLIDAAWRSQAAILDECFEDAGAVARGVPLRIAIELEVDGRGRVVSASAKLPSTQGASPAEPLARCLEAAVRASLRLPVAPNARATRARTELLIGTP